MTIIRSNFILYFLLLLYCVNANAQIRPQWEPREDLNILLPSSVKVFEAKGQLEDGKFYRAVHATVDLRDENLVLRALGSNTLRQTTEETSRQNNGILAINGGYFSSKASVSLLVSDGKILSPGLTPKVSRGAFTMMKGRPEILWTRAGDTGSVKMMYSSASSLGNGKEFHANQAVGGGPVLIREGRINVTAEQEGFGGSHVLRHPRSAIGYKDEHTLVIMVVDGRQPASAGVTLTELADLMLSAGAVEAVNLDGGGSSALVAANEVVNVPADIPGGDRNSLRKNASALVLSEIIQPEEKEIVYLDTDSDNYAEIGLWKTSNLSNYYGRTPSRTALASHTYNEAIYTFEGLSRRPYQLAAWWTVDEENTQETAYVLHHGRTTDTLWVDQSSWSGSGKWNVLGNFIIGPEDFLKVLGAGTQGKMQVDAIRLVPNKNMPELPLRGDQRIAVISDLNSGLGAADYQWQVDSILDRIPRIWKPDLVISGGDMVAGMGISDTSHLRKMWTGFDQHIARPLREHNIPFAFTLGNHDGPRSYPLERKIAAEYWNKQEHDPGLEFVDREFFPNYYSFVKDSLFFVSWEASSSEITQANLTWLEEQFNSPEAQSAAFRFVMGHMPLYSVAQERNSKGNVLNDPVKLQRLLEKYNVHTYISGHQHAYYPGKRGDVEFLNTGAAGSGPRSWLNLDRKPVNTITIMDVFHEKDSITYTTYNIKEKDAKDLQILDETRLPSSMFGVNGHLLRRDLTISTKASGIFSNRPVFGQSAETGMGTASATMENQEVIISGKYSSLQGRIRKDNGLALYLGRNTESGTFLAEIEPLSRTEKNGSFRARFQIQDIMAKVKISEIQDAVTDFQELLSVGALYVALRTETGILRAQLVPENNTSPHAPAITSHLEKNIYAVRDTEALYEINWKPEQDKDGDLTSYTYQVARDRDFKRLVFEAATGRNSSLKKTERFWFKLLGNTPLGQPVQFFHRVIASDGKNNNFSPGAGFRLMKSDEPLDDFAEVEAPSYEFAGKIDAAGAGYGAEWDGDGKLWLADYRGALIIKETNGADASFSPVRSIEVNGRNYGLNPINGLGIDKDGNILVGSNHNLLKIDASTGKGIAAWEVPDGGRAITSPRANEKGEIYAMSLFGEDPNYVLKQSEEDSSSFELLRTIHLDDRILSRTFDMTSDGMTLYFPNPGSPLIQAYTSKDGTMYQEDEKITSLAAGSSAIQVLHNSILVSAVKSSGISPSSFHYRDEKQQKMWTMYLPEVNGAEPRGIGVSPDGKTIIFCSWDKGGGYYKYLLKD